MRITKNFVCAAVLFILLAALGSVGAAAEPGPAYAAQDKAIAEYTEVLAKNPRDAVAYYFRGRAYTDKGEYPLAVSDFTKAVEFNPKYAAAYFGRGYAQSKLEGDTGPSDKAIEDYSQAIKIDATYTVAYVNRAVHYNRKQQYDKAIEDTTKALELNPNYTNAYFVRSLAYEKRHQYEEAIATLREVMAITKDQGAIDRAKAIIRSLGGIP